MFEEYFFFRERGDWYCVMVLGVLENEVEMVFHELGKYWKLFKEERTGCV